MNKLYAFLGSCLLITSTWVIAEEVELLDTYLEELPSTTSSGQNIDSGTNVDQPQMIKYRRIESADDNEIYEEVPINHASSAGNVNSDSQTSSDIVIKKNATVSNDLPSQNSENLEVIELEPDEGEVVVIEAPDIEITQTGRSADIATNTGSSFCLQNPYARECLLAKYLSKCKKDPQSAGCKSQLQKFDRFCEIFPNAYKCKKAKIASSCKQNPNANECKTFTQRYCQKYPKAIFCNYN